MIYDRPISAKINEEKKRTTKNITHNNDLMVSNFSKKRYPSSNNRDDPYRWK